MLAPLIQHENLFPILSSRLPKLLPKTSQTLHPMPVFEARVLVVEDDAALRRLLTMLLERENYHVVAVANGAEAVSTFAQYAFDLILMDIMMPIMDGLSACAHIRTHSAVPIILLSAFSSAEIKAKAKNSGASHFLHKPIRPKELKQQLQQFLSKPVHSKCDDS